MKRLSLILTFFLLLSVPCCVSISAQTSTNVAKNPPVVKFPSEKPDFQGILQLKYNYIKENLTVSEANATKFWVLYDKYIKDENAIHAAFKKAMDNKNITREALREGKGTDEQVSFYLAQKMAYKDKMYMLDKKFYNEAKNILSAKELYDFYHLEQNFKNQCTKRQMNANAAAATKKAVPQQKPQPNK